MVQRSLGELKTECTKLGLSVVQSGKREAKKDFVDALAKFHYQSDPRKGQFGFEYILNKIESPALCQRYQELKPAEQDAIWADGNEWIVEEKIDGCRMLVTYDPATGFDFYSRNISVSNYLPISYKDTVYLTRDFVGAFENRFVLDCEVVSVNPNINTILGNRGVVTDTQLAATTALLAMDPERSLPIQKETGGFKFIAFDVLFYGDDMKSLPMVDRRDYLKILYDLLENAGFPISRSEMVYEGKREFFIGVLARGGEGIVAKNLSKEYVATESRRRDVWVKVKRAQGNAMGDNIDGFVTGFLPAVGANWIGLVGSLEISVFVQKADGSEVETPIAMVSNIPLELRREMTETVDGQPALKKEYYKRVVEVTGQDFSARARRLTHAAIVTWRPDRDYLSCKLAESVIEKGIL